MVYTPERDHSAIKIHIKSDELKYKRGPGFWKFNQSLLQDEIYVSSPLQEIPNFKQKYVDVEDLWLKWDKRFYNFKNIPKYSKEKKICEKKSSKSNQRALQKSWNTTK